MNTIINVLSSDIIDDIIDIINEEGGVEYELLTEAVRFIGNLFDNISGLMITLVLITIPLIVALDIAYINFPILQNMIGTPEEIKDGNKRVVGLVLRDAQKALIKYEKSERAENVNMVYLGIKLKSLIISITIIAVIFGLGSYVIDFIVTITKGILDGLI